MSTNRIKNILGVEKSKKSVNTDTYLSINLDGEQKQLPPDEINHVLNINDRFNFERQQSKSYRIIGTINSLASNSLFNLSNPILLNKNTWSGFNSYDFLDNSYPKDNQLDDAFDLSYPQSIKKYLIERDGWFGYLDPDKSKLGVTNFIDMEPKRDRFSFISDIKSFSGGTTQIKNWELTITYPKLTDKTHYMVNGGLLITEALPAVVSTRNMVAFGMPCLHNLEIGSVVKITGTTGFDGEHVVVRVGLDNGDLKNYYFVIDIPYSAGTIGGSSRIKRMFGGIESEYYFRKFRKIKTKNSPIIEIDDYETYKLSFSQNIYNDPLSQFVFNEDIDVSDLTDNLGRPLSELYLSIIKTDSAGLFSPISSGIETPFISSLNTSGTNTFLRNVPVINKIHNGSSLPFISHIPLETNIDINNYDFYGDLVEYNLNEVKETILANVAHRFNTLNRESAPTLNYVSTIGSSPTTQTITLGPRQEGYFYNPHILLKIREFSNYVEQGDKFTDGVPDYAVILNDGRYLWRDILDIGFNESNETALDYPFLNGSHYLYINNCFSIRRQDPFGNWGLFYSKFPSDPVGDHITDKFTINIEDNVC